MRQTICYPSILKTRWLADKWIWFRSRVAKHGSMADRILLPVPIVSNGGGIFIVWHPLQRTHFRLLAHLVGRHQEKAIPMALWNPRHFDCNLTIIPVENNHLTLLAFFSSPSFSKNTLDGINILKGTVIAFKFLFYFGAELQSKMHV